MASDPRRFVSDIKNEFPKNCLRNHLEDFKKSALLHLAERVIMHAMHQISGEDDNMDCKAKIKELRERTGMNRKEFCDYFQIPYRTVTDWERDNRHAPEYVLRLLEYYIRMEELGKKREDT